MSYRKEPDQEETCGQLAERIETIVSEFKASNRLDELDNILRAAELQLEGPEAVETQRQLLAMQNHLKLLAESVVPKEQPEPISVTPDGGWISINDSVMVEPYKTAKLDLHPERDPHILPKAIRFSVEDAGVMGSSDQFKIRLLSVEIQRWSQLDKWRREEEEDPLLNSQSSGILGLGRLMRVNWAVIGALPNQRCEIVVYNPHCITMRVEAEIFGEPPPREPCGPGYVGGVGSGWRPGGS